MSGISAMLSSSMHSAPTVDSPEPARNGLSHRASKTSLSSEREIWHPPTTPDGTGTTSRALAYAVLDSPAPPPPARRDSFASSTGRASRSGSIQSGYVQIDPEVPSSAYIPRGRNLPEEPVPQSSRAREKQREAQPQLVRPRIPSDIASRRNDDRPPPAWSQMTDGHFPFMSSGVDYPPLTERKGIPIKSQGASTGRRGSPEDLRHMRTASKNSWGYDSSPGSAGLYGPHSVQSNLAPGARPSLVRKQSFTGDDDIRLPQTSPITRMRNGSKGRRDSTGSHSLRSQRSRPDIFTRQDGVALSPLPSDESTRSTNELGDESWEEGSYGLGNFEVLDKCLHFDETLRYLDTREEDIKQRVNASERKAADADRKMADAEKRDSEARRRDEEARQRDQEARDRMEDVRKLETSARKLEEAVRQRERELRSKEDEARQREVKIRAREDEVLRKEDIVRTKAREAQKKWDEVARKMQRMEEDVVTREDALKAREEALSAQETVLMRREEDVKQREVALSVVETDLSQRDADIALHESVLQHRDDELKTKEFMLRTLEEQLKAREVVVAHEERQQEQARMDESRRAQAERQQEDDERRRQGEEAQQAEKTRTEEAQRVERVQAEQRAQREEEVWRLAEDRRLKEEEKKRREDERRRQVQQREEAKRKEEQVLEENRQREAAQRQAVEADIRRRTEATRRESAEQPNGTQHDAPPVDEDMVFDAENISPELIRQQEALLKQYARNRNDSMSSDGSPRSTAFVSASQSAPRNIPGRAGSSAGAPAADRSSTASSSSYQSSAGFSFSSGHSSTSTYTQASTHSQASTATPSSTPTPSVKQTRGGWKPAGAPPTSATTAQSQFAAAASLPPPTPQEEEDWKRRQQEQAREQAEKFQRMQEQAEQDRYTRTTKQLSREEVVKIFEDHERRWARLSNLDVFTWYSLPWPVLQRANSPEELTLQAMQAYVFSPHHPQRKKPARDVVKEYIKRWHPDRFENKYLPKVREDDREKVKEGAGLVARNLNELLTKQSKVPDFAT